MINRSISRQFCEKKTCSSVSPIKPLFFGKTNQTIVPERRENTWRSACNVPTFTHLHESARSPVSLGSHVDSSLRLFGRSRVPEIRGWITCHAQIASSFAREQAKNKSKNKTKSDEKRTEKKKHGGGTTRSRDGRNGCNGRPYGTLKQQPHKQ